MKRVLVVLLMLGLTLPAFGASQWDKLETLGTRLVADVDAYTVVNNAALDRLLYDYRDNFSVIYASASTLTILPGRAAIPNAAGSVVRWRGETSSTTVTWSNLDTGSEANSTQYYVYLSGDTDETGINAVISTSASAPSGITYYKKVAYFYNNSAGNIVNVGNIKSDGEPNIVEATGTTNITSTSASYEDMTDMEVRIVTNGRPIKISYCGGLICSDATTAGKVVIDIDGTDYKAEIISSSSGGYLDSFFDVVTSLASGAHTIKMQWYRTSGSGSVMQSGATYERILAVEEL